MSSLDEAYVALRDLLKAGPASTKTRESALRAVRRLHNEALARTILGPAEQISLDDDPPQVA